MTNQISQFCISTSKKAHWQYHHLSLLYCLVIIDVSYFLNQCFELRRRSVEYLLRWINLVAKTNYKMSIKVNNPNYEEELRNNYEGEWPQLRRIWYIITLCFDETLSNNNVYYIFNVDLWQSTPQCNQTYSK